MDISFLKPLTVLYAEDEADTRNSMTRILNKFFGDVLTVQDGQEGWETYQSEQKIDLIITDINMPRLNGLEMIKKIRENDNEIPIILITAHSESNYLLDAINQNVSQYVIKPVNTMKLVENIQKSYLPIHQKKLLEEKNEELKLLNIKIKEVAKQEMENILNGEQYLVDNDIDFGDYLDNITLDD